MNGKMIYKLIKHNFFNKIIELRKMSTSTKILKIALIGEAGSGKTSFVDKIGTNVFTQFYFPTERLRIHSCLHPQNDGTKTCFEIYEFPGQLQYETFDDKYYPETDLAIVFYDLGKENINYTNLNFWMNKYKKLCPGKPMILCGNKSDLNKNKNKNELYEDKIGDICTFGIQISVKTNFNFDILIDYLDFNFIKPKVIKHQPIITSNENKESNLEAKINNEDIYNSLFTVLKTQMTNDLVRKNIVEILHSIIISSELRTISKKMKNVGFDDIQIDGIINELNNFKLSHEQNFS